jgi:hypothetical protein
MQKTSLVLACAFVFAFGVCAQQPTPPAQTAQNDSKATVKSVG